MSGWIKVKRNIIDHWVWQDEKFFRWWMTILLLVNYKEKNFTVGDEIYTCNPGESFRSIAEWTRLFGCAKKTTLKFFSMLKKEHMIETKIVGKGNRRKHLLIVANWDKYQQTETEVYTERKPDFTPKGNPNVPPNKNEKNEKKGKNNIESKSRFKVPTLDEINSYYFQKCEEKSIDPNLGFAENFFSFYDSKNWMVGKNKMSNWKSAVTGWINRNYEKAKSDIARGEKGAETAKTVESILTEIEQTQR